MNQAVCKFCGQIMTCDVPDGASQAECERLGTMQCNCEEARIYRKRQERAEKAKLELDIMLSADDEDNGFKAAPQTVIDLLKAAVDLMADDCIFKIDVGICLGGKIDIKSGTGGKISIKRTVTQNLKREVE